MSTQQQITVGIPNALLNHLYAPMWLHFFRTLGCKVVTSPNTNLQIIETGSRHSIDETCLAVKIFLGHVEALITKVDYVFIPRIVSLYKNEQFCVKFFGLADVVRNTFQDVKILEYTIDVNTNKWELAEIFKMARQIQPNPIKIIKAYFEGRKRLEIYNSKRLAKQEKSFAVRDPQKITVLLAAHPYVSYDAMLGKSVAKILTDLDVEIVYSDIVDTRLARALSVNLSKDLYWSLSKEMLGAIEYYRAGVDGIIFLMTFPCGPDALVIDLCKNVITDLPVSVIIMDELQGDAGLKTRLESFIDILEMKKYEQATS